MGRRPARAAPAVGHATSPPAMGTGEPGGATAVFCWAGRTREGASLSAVGDVRHEKATHPVWVARRWNYTRVVKESTTPVPSLLFSPANSKPTAA